MEVKPMATIPDYELPDVSDVEIALGADNSRFWGNPEEGDPEGQDYWDAAKKRSYAVRQELRDEVDDVSTLMFKGGSLSSLGRRLKEGVSGEKFSRALRALMASWNVSHEQKEATVALLFYHYTEKTT
jgi:hypothetical protein